VELTVRDIMEVDVPAVYPSDPMESVLKVLRAHQLPGIPVINEGGRCVGIITEADLVISEQEEDLHLPHHFQLFGGVVFLGPMSEFEERIRKAFASTAGDVMTEDPVTIEARAPVETAAELIARTRFNRLPAVEHGRLVGVVTRVAVLDALINER
jgi:CBS domain-containing protein